MKTPDVIYGGMDGVITTLTTIMAASAADLKPAIILTVGIAKIVADAYSMAVGRYLSEPGSTREALVTFVSFVVAGVVPLMPYILNVQGGRNLSIVLSLVVFWYLGKLQGMGLGISAAGISYLVAKNI